MYLTALGVAEISMDDFRVTFYCAQFFVKGLSNNTFRKHQRCKRKIDEFLQLHSCTDMISRQFLQAPFAFTSLEAEFFIFLTTLVVNDGYT